VWTWPAAALLDDPVRADTAPRTEEHGVNIVWKAWHVGSSWQAVAVVCP
jgi:hypothetical protein